MSWLAVVETFSMTEIVCFGILIFYALIASIIIARSFDRGYRQGYWQGYHARKRGEKLAETPKRQKMMQGIKARASKK